MTTCNDNAITMKKACTKCGNVLAINRDNFYRDKSQKDMHSPWCKDCERDYNKSYRSSLKKVAVSRVCDIGDADAFAMFESGMSNDRVTRGEHKANRVVVKARKSRAKKSA